MGVGNQTPAGIASDYATFAFIVQQKLSQIATLALVRVIDCTNNGGIVPVGTLTVQPLVNMMSGDRTAFPHKLLYEVLYQRVQGGASAVILDPKPGDIGLVGFCSRDISAVKTAKDIANPGSFRQFSMSDGVYLFTCLGGIAPTQYVVLNDEGVNVVSPTQITLQAPTINFIGDVVQEGGDVSMAQALDVQGQIHSATDVVSDNISGKLHTHNDPQGGVVGPPNP
jgi:hypothetical protein